MQLLLHSGVLSIGYSSSPGLLLQGHESYHRLYLCRPHPWLHQGLLHSCVGRSALCSAHSLQTALPWASPELQRAAAPRVEHVMPSSCTDLDSLMFTAPPSDSRCAVLFFYSFLKMLSQRHHQCILLLSCLEWA